MPRAGNLPARHLSAGAVPAMIRMLEPTAKGGPPRRPVVLASMDWLRPGDPPFGLGVASIASALRRAGACVRVVSDAVNRPGFSKDGFIAEVQEAVDRAGLDALVGISAFVWCEPEVQELLPALDWADIVLGGPQVSYAAVPGELESLYPGAKYFVRGQGEAAMVALVARRARNGSLGLHVAGQPDLLDRADFPPARLPSPHLDGTMPVGKFVRWETQRGCTFSCSFCQHPGVDARLRHAQMGISRLRREIAAFRDAGVERVNALDPVFNTDAGRAVRLLKEFRRTGPDAHLSLQCRFEMVDEAFLDAAGRLNATLEFGLQTVHDDEALEVRRPNCLEKVEKVIADLNGHGIPYEVSLIYGLPRQTLDRFQKSVDWLRERGARTIRAWPLMLLRGTNLYYQRGRWGYAESGGRIPIAIESDSFSRDDHAEMTRIAEGL